MPPTRKQLALRYLRRKLERGELPPGSRLSDAALAKEMGISRTPVREAIQTLVAEGVARSAPHAGVFVRQLTRDDVRELYELREALEGFAAARIAARADSAANAANAANAGEAIEALRASCRTLRELEAAAKAAGGRLLSADDTLRQREADLAFHRALIRGADNGRIARTVQDSALLTHLFATMPARMEVKVLRAARANHVKVLRAIERGDPDAARAAMAAHIQSGLAGRLADWDDDAAAAGPLADLSPALRSVLDEE